MIRILLVDDQKTVRESLKISLEPELDLQIVGTAENGINAIEQVDILQPDIVVMNMEMPLLDGASATKKITSKYSDIRVLMLTSYDTDEYITKSLAMGAKGYLLKNTNTQDIAGAIRNIHKGYTQISPGLLEKLLVYTDSGIILSKLQNPAKISQNITTVNSSAVMTKPQKNFSNLRIAYLKQQEEIAKLKAGLEENKQEIPLIRKNLSINSKFSWLVGALGLLTLAALAFSLFKLDNKTDLIQARAESIETNVIPVERVGLYGKFSLSGLAERVVETFSQDSALDSLSTIYVAQENDSIILIGTVPNASLLRRMENLAKQVPGVGRVYTSQVAIRKDSGAAVLGSQKIE